jgi:hypothetical protein
VETEKKERKELLNPFGYLLPPTQTTTTEHFAAVPSGWDRLKRIGHRKGRREERNALYTPIYRQNHSVAVFHHYKNGRKRRFGCVFTTSIGKLDGAH